MLYLHVPYNNLLLKFIKTCGHLITIFVICFYQESLKTRIKINAGTFVCTLHTIQIYVDSSLLIVLIIIFMFFMSHARICEKKYVIMSTWTFHFYIDFATLGGMHAITATRSIAKNWIEILWLSVFLCWLRRLYLKNQLFSTINMKVYFTLPKLNIFSI